MNFQCVFVNGGGYVGKFNQCNKKSGSDFENEFCELVSHAGFWAHCVKDNKNGQPADVIVSKNNNAALIDCKDCENDMFPMSRIEENQELAMTKWLLCGNLYADFALKTSAGIRIIGIEKLLELRAQGLKRLNLAQIEENSISFSEWVEVFGGSDC